VPIPALTAVTLGPSQTDPGVEVSSETNPVVVAAVDVTGMASAPGGSAAGRWALLVLLLALLAATVVGWLQALRSNPPTPTAPSDER
jgi:hypothetical protein